MDVRAVRNGQLKKDAAGADGYSKGHCALSSADRRKTAGLSERSAPYESLLFEERGPEKDGGRRRKLLQRPSGRQRRSFLACGRIEQSLRMRFLQEEAAFGLVRASVKRGRRSPYRSRAGHEGRLSDLHGPSVGARGIPHQESGQVHSDVCPVYQGLRAKLQRLFGCRRKPAGVQTEQTGLFAVAFLLSCEAEKLAAHLQRRQFRLRLPSDVRAL